MKLPENVNPLEFVRHAKLQGVKITSRYNGVCLNMVKNKPYWFVRYQARGKFKYIGRFEFTIKGEIEARNAYLNYLQSIGIEERYKVKKTRKCQKQKK